MSGYITIACSKGYLLEESIKIFNKIGITFSEDLTKSRKLYTFDDSGSIRILQIRPWDVPVYVEQGAADLGIMGKDVIWEKEEDVVSLLDLNFGACDLVIAGLNKIEVDKLPHYLRIATKYPNSTQKYFQKLGLKVKIIKMYGAIELGPMTGLCDLVCDLTATGKTLKENKLHIIDTVFKSTACLVANPVSMRFEYNRICDLAQKIKNVLSTTN